MSNIRILLVDDDELVRAALSQVLEHSGGSRLPLPATSWQH